MGVGIDAEEKVDEGGGALTYWTVRAAVLLQQGAASTALQLLLCM